MALVPWPEHAEELARLRAERTPSLLLVGPETTAPPIMSDLEDWVQLPADPDEIDARRMTLAVRAATQVVESPWVDSDGLLHFRGQWVALSPIDQGLVEALVGRFGAVVPMQSLAGRAGVEPGRGTLRVQITRLRARLEPLGLEVLAVRARGYLLRVVTDGAPRQPGLRASWEPAPSSGGR